MSQDYKIRRDVIGEVFVGAWAENQPARLRLTPAQPSVRKGLELLGWDSARINAEIPKYKVYVPVTLVPDFSQDRIVDMNVKKKFPKAEAKLPTEPATPEKEEAKVEPVAPASPPEAEEMKLTSIEDAVVPHPKEIAEMSRDELEVVAIRFDVLDMIKGRGSNGYRTVKDFKKFLIPWSEKQLQSK
jgi:hypothetical protein